MASGWWKRISRMPPGLSFRKFWARSGNIPALMWLAGLGETSADSYVYIVRALAIDPE
jgi:hypothetical protein